jgi:excisionase family DNA binding protein
MSTQDSSLCSTREAAAMLGVSLRTAQLWVESGVLSAWKTAGGHRRILKSSVDALIRERKLALQGPARPGQFKILVVEDDPDLLKLYHMHIEGWGLPVALRTAANGFEGLIRIGEAKPDLLIADLNMPGMDGFRMIRSLRNNADFKNMEIVVVTALGKNEIADRGGFSDDISIFTKPAPFSALEQLVRKRLEHTKPKHARLEK